MELEELQENFKQFIQESNKLTVFVAGNVGSGKSTLVNSLLGGKAAAVGSSLESVTQDVENFDGLVKVTQYINNVSATVWDCPGLQDPELNDKEKESLLKRISDTCSDIDLVVYCIQMTKTRFEAGDIASMCDLTKALGVSMWEKTMFVLTFANKLELPTDCDKEISLKEYFYQRKEEWSGLLHRYLIRKAGVDAEIADKVPVVAAGYDREPLPYLAPGGGWYFMFWHTCCKIVLLDALPAFFVVSDFMEMSVNNAPLHDIVLKKLKSVIDEDKNSSSLCLGIIKAQVKKNGLEYSVVGDQLLHCLVSAIRELMELSTSIKEIHLQREKANKHCVS